jgi:hypothetical protein
MGRDIDVYQLLRSFSRRNAMSEIDYKIFAQAVQRQAKLSDQSLPIFRDLSQNPDTILIPRLFLLAKDKKLTLQTAGNEIRSIVLPERFAELFFQEYQRMEESPDVPFPDEDSLKVVVPPEWMRSISIESDLGPLSDSQTPASVPLYKLAFSGGVRPIVLPASYVPDRLLDCSFQKLRYYLRKGANKEFMYNKLSSAFPNREGQLKDAIAAILTKPTEAIESLKRSNSDFTYSFWAYFVSAIKKDLDGKKEKTAEDWSQYQAALICEFFANHYKAKAQRLLDLEAAVKALDVALRKPPFHFALEEIHAFPDAKGAPLSGVFGKEALEALIHKKSTVAEAGVLPELLVVSTGEGKAYVPKDKALHLAVRQIAEARSELRSKILDKWRKLIADYKSCPAMEEDSAFLGELAEQISASFPMLDSLIRDRLLPLVRDEAASKGDLPEDVAHLFYRDDLVPLDELLNLSRKALLVDARMLLPFWYSVPILSGLARFFHSLSKQRAKKEAERVKAAKQAAEAERTKEDKVPTPQHGATAKERRAEFEAAASRVANELLPEGRELDEYLRELQGRWNTLLNPEAKKNLNYDVDSLARDYLKNVVRTMNSSSLTTARIRNLGSTLADSASLQRIKNHQALEQYLQLYMVKVLGAHIDVRH